MWVCACNPPANVSDTRGVWFVFHDTGGIWCCQVARTFKHLRSFVHVSTAYVNSFQPCGARVAETAVPLEFDPQQVRMPWYACGME